MEEVRVGSLVEDGIIAIRGRKSLAWSSAWNILFPIVVEEIGRVQSCPFGQDVCALGDESVRSAAAVGWSTDLAACLSTTRRLLILRHLLRQKQ
jgi:hypothetical protein